MADPSKGRADAEIIFTEWNIDPMKSYAERMDALAAAKLGYIFLSSQKSPTLPTLYERGKVTDKLKITYNEREAITYIEFE